MSNNRRIACVSGGTSGIGLAVVSRLVEESYEVITFSRTIEKCEALKKAMGDKAVHVLQGDVSQANFRTHLVTEIESTYGRLDVLVNNAGVFVGEGGSIEETLSTWQETLNTNLIGVFALTQALYPLLQKGKKPSIINISSVCGMAPSAKCGSLAYSVSKAGVDLLTQGLAQALGRDGIRVNSINPGVVNTPIWDGFGDAMTQRAQERHVLQGQVVQPADIAATVAFLISPEAALITGAILPVDAGYAVS